MTNKQLSKSIKRRKCPPCPCLFWTFYERKNHRRRQRDQSRHGEIGKLNDFYFLVFPQTSTVQRRRRRRRSRLVRSRKVQALRDQSGKFFHPIDPESSDRNPLDLNCSMLLCSTLLSSEVLSSWERSEQKVLQSAEDRPLGAVGAQPKRGSGSVFASGDQESASAYLRRQSRHRWIGFCGQSLWNRWLVGFRMEATFCVSLQG